MIKKIKIAIKEKNILQFKQECIKYYSEKQMLIILKETIKENELEFFKISMNKFLSPVIFWEINKELIKKNEYEFLKIMIDIFRKSETDKERKNDYVNQLLFDFIEKDDLFFVDYLIKKGKASTKNIPENEVTVLNECVKNNSIKCFDYFLTNGKNIHDFEDIALLNALLYKRYTILEMILNVAETINPDIEKNFYRYYNKNLQNKELLLLADISKPFLEKSEILQNGLNYELIKRGLLKELEENLEKGYSPIGDENYNLIDLAINKDKYIDKSKIKCIDSIKTIKLLLDYGSFITDEQKSNLSKDDQIIIHEYPRFTKLKDNLFKKFSIKGKGNTVKI